MCVCNVDWSDDDDDDDEADPPANQQQQQQQQQTAPTQQPTAAGTDNTEDDYLDNLLDEMLEDNDPAMHDKNGDGLLAGKGQKQSNADVDPGMQDTQQQRSRLPRKLAVTDISEDDDMADPDLQEAGGPRGAKAANVQHQHEQQQEQPHTTLQHDDMDAPQHVANEATEQSVPQQQRRQWLLADDDSDGEAEDVAVGSAPAVPSQPHTTQVSNQAGLGTQQHEEFAPLVFGAESVGFDSVDEMQLVMGTDLDGLQQ